MRNPLQEIKQEKGWSISDMAMATDTSTSTTYKNLEGSFLNVSDNILDTLEKMGYKREKIKKQYQEFRKDKKERLIS